MIFCLTFRAPIRGFRLPAPGNESPETETADALRELMKA